MRLMLFLPVLSAHSSQSAPLCTLVQSPLIIQYHPQDSTLAKSLPQRLSASLEELHHDLNVPFTTPYCIVIAPSQDFYRQYLTSGLPTWASAFAVPAIRTAVIKSPRWDRPESDLGKNLLHELVHLVLHERTGHHPLPRWLDEGLALFYEGPRPWDYPLTLSKALYTRSLIPLEQIDTVLSFQKSKADLAYQQCYSAVTYFLSTYDTDGLQIVLEGFRHKKTPDEIFRQATGSTFAAFEQEWQHAIEKKYRYHWLSEWDSFLWFFIILLAAVAAAWIRRRNRRTVAQWESQAKETMPGNPPIEDPAQSEIEVNDSFIEKDPTNE